MIESEIELFAERESRSEWPKCGIDYPSVRQLLANAVGEDKCDDYGRPDPTSDDIAMWRAMVERAEADFLGSRL